MTIIELNEKCSEKYNEIKLDLNDVDNRVTVLESLFEKLSNSVEAMQSLTRSVDKLALNMDNTLKELKLQNARLSELEKKPVKRWETVTQAAVTTAVGILIGWLFSYIFKGSV